MDKISSSDKKLLYARSCNICAYPECDTNLTKRVDGTSLTIGEMGHIVSRQKKGPRYDPDFPRERLDAYDNRILLCHEHHVEIDQIRSEWSTESLHKMKSDHESEVVRRLAGGCSWKSCVKDLAEFITSYTETKFHQYMDDGRRLTRGEIRVGGTRPQSDEVDGYFLAYRHLPQLWQLAKKAGGEIRKAGLRSGMAYQTVCDIMAWADKARASVVFQHDRKAWFDGLPGVPINPILGSPRQLVAALDSAEPGD